MTDCDKEHREKLGNKSTTTRIRPLRHALYVSPDDYGIYERRYLATESGASVQQRFVVWDAQSCRNGGYEGGGRVNGEQVRGRKEAGGDIP